MKKRLIWSRCIPISLMALFTFIGLLPLSGCNGIPLPGIPVTITVAQDVEIPASSVVAGSTDVSVGAFCDFFSDEHLRAVVRAAAGDEIANLVSITGIELEAVNVTATSGTFSPLTTADLNLELVNSNAGPIPLGTAFDPNGLGTDFSLTQDMSVDLLNDLEDGQCGTPNLHLEGAGLAEVGNITFSVTADVMVFTELSAP